MAQKLSETERVIPDARSDAVSGRVVFEPWRALWVLGMLLGALVGLLFFASWSALFVFLALSSFTLCLGHSVGMHRLLIHRSFEAPLWLEHILVYLGVLVGMAGPFGMMRAHDMRDWHQRQAECPAHPSHDAPFFKDAFWQLCCRYQLTNVPEFRLEPQVRRDGFYRFLEATWMAQQLPLAVILFFSGGWSWLLWGVCLRVAVSLIGHWAVGHLAHRRGHQSWHIRGLPVQGYDLPKIAFITFGESLHGNHHAFPHSANLAIEAGQVDLGYVVIKSFACLGLAQNIKTPKSAPFREGLERVSPVLAGERPPFFTSP